MGRAGRVLSRIDKAVFEPGAMPEGGVALIALVPSLVAGLVFFKVAAATALVLAIGFGSLFSIVAWRLGLRAGIAPVVAGIVAVALIGPAAPISFLAVATALAPGLEVARRRWLPFVNLQPGLLVAAVLFLASRGATAAYLNPGRLRPLAEPIRLWSTYYGGSAAPIDPVRLYVGNVPGPMFATSLLAVVVGAAWLWYARRLSLVVLLTFVLGAVIPIAVWRWNPGFQLGSGPAWFVVALVLADRATLPESRASRPLIGFAAGVAGIGLRRQGLGIEAIWLAVAGLQLVVAGVEATEWLVTQHGRVSGPMGVLRQLTTGRRTTA